MILASNPDRAVTVRERARHSECQANGQDPISATMIIPMVRDWILQELERLGIAESPAVSGN